MKIERRKKRLQIQEFERANWIDKVNMKVGNIKNHIHVKARLPFAHWPSLSFVVLWKLKLEGIFHSITPWFCGKSLSFYSFIYHCPIIFCLLQLPYGYGRVTQIISFMTWCLCVSDVWIRSFSWETLLVLLVM